MLKRVAILGIFHESNTFIGKPTTLTDFMKGHLLKGADMLTAYREAHHEIGGMAGALERKGIGIVPVMYAEATPGGIISSAAYNCLLEEMMHELEKVLPVDYDMGLTAIVLTEKGSTVMLTSLRIPPFSLRQLTDFDVSPGDFDVIVAKGVNAPIAAYGPACPAIVQVDTPGVTRADMTSFVYRNRRKPLFPFEDLHN